MSAHGDADYPILGETDATSGELATMIRTAYGLSDIEIARVLDLMRDLSQFNADRADLELEAQQRADEAATKPKGK